MGGNNVFINCPFDTEYRKLLNVLLFTTCYFNLNPKIALENSDCKSLRLDRIIRLMNDSQYSIHDLSRIKANSPDEFYRLNMSFELGLDYGLHKRATHPFLILEDEKYSYQKGLSDISGLDIKAHTNSPEKLNEILRNWYICTISGLDLNLKQKAPNTIWYLYMECYGSFYDKKTSQGFSSKQVSEIPIAEYIEFVKEWIKMLNGIST